MPESRLILLRNWAQNEKVATFTFIYDDHYVGDFIAQEQFESRGWVFNSAMVPTRLVNLFASIRNPFAETYRRLQSKGGSVLAHTMNHVNMKLGALPMYQAEYEIIQSRMYCEKLGFEVNGYVSPYSETHAMYKKYITDNFDYAFNVYMGNLTEWIASGKKPYHTVSDDIYALTRVSTAVATNTLAELKNAVDLAVQNNGFICFYDHSIGGATGTEISEADNAILLDYIKAYEAQGLCQVLPTDQAVYNYFGAGKKVKEKPYISPTPAIVSNFESTTNMYLNHGKWLKTETSGVNSVLTPVNGHTVLDIPSMVNTNNVTLSTIIDFPVVTDKTRLEKIVYDFSVYAKILSNHNADQLDISLDWWIQADGTVNDIQFRAEGFYPNKYKHTFVKEKQYKVRISPTSQLALDNGTCVRVMIKFTAKASISNVSILLDDAKMTTVG